MNKRRLGQQIAPFLFGSSTGPLLCNGVMTPLHKSLWLIVITLVAFHISGI